VLDELDYPMFIATVPGDGCLVGFATQCSIDPLRFLVCLSNKNRTYRLARDATHMALHAVPENRPELAELFGGETADEVDKLEQVDVKPGPNGVPLIAGCPYVAGPVLDRFDVGDHVAFLLDVEVEEGAAKPMRFSRARSIDPGHEA
jgi:flavin reductase (DIM6/NTAB) family NADH-FMN oxidoreductase RutF